MEADIVIHNIGELVTFPEKPLRRPERGNAGIVGNALLAVRRGKVVYAGPEADAPNIRARRRVNARGLLVTPGLVDPHTHPVFSGDRSRELLLKLEGRSYREILESGGGIYYTVEMTRGAGDEELAHGMEEALILMLEHGTTSVEAKTGYGLTVEEELRQLKIILETSKRVPQHVTPTLLAHVIPQEYMDSREEYVELLAAKLIPQAAMRGAEYFDVFCDKGAYTCEETRRLFRAALSAGLKLRLHADEIAYIGCSRLALEFPVHSVDHLENTPPEVVEALSRTRTVATLLPTSMLSVFTSKKPPVEALRRYGVPIALGTDYNPNNMNPNMQSAIDASIYLLRLKPLEALAAATANAAYSLDLHDRGCLAPGCRADIIVWGLERVEQLGYYWGYNRALLVLSEGAPVAGDMLEAAL